MAITTISRIQHRRGLFRDFKGLNLASGEIAWALDKRRLFIGNGEIAEGATQEGNTEVFTEFSPHLDLMRYQYLWREKDPLTGSLVPRVNAGWQALRRLQERLDERVSVKAFGVRGDGNENPLAVDEETLNLRRAMYEMFLREPFSLYDGSVGPWRALYVPAGIYVINRPLPFLRKTILIGDGSGRTIIKMGVPAVAGQDYVAGTATFQRENASQTFADYPDDVGLFDRFEFPPVPNAQWAGGDILQLGFPVEDILVTGITFMNTTQGDVVRVANAQNVSFIDCDFVGYEYDCSQTPVIGATSTLSRAVYVSGPSGSDVDHAMKTKKITFSDCRFSKRGYGLYAKDDVVQVTVMNSMFTDLFDGVNVGEDLGDVGSPVANPSSVEYLWGPRGVHVETSHFDMIRRYGFAVFTPGTNNGSLSNHYERTGIALTNVCTIPGGAVTPCDFEYEAIFFYSDPAPNREGATDNFAIGDSFGRQDIHYDVIPCVNKDGVLYRIGNENGKNTVITNTWAQYSDGISMGGIMMDPMNVDAIVLTPTAQPQQISFANGEEAFFDLNETNTLIVEYSLKRDSFLRVGMLRCIATDTTIATDDDYQEMANIGVVFSFVKDSATSKLQMQYTMSAGNDARLYIFVRKWKTD
jgi:hypothetical protein